MSLLELRVPGTGRWTKGDDVAMETTGGAETLPQRQLAQSEHLRDMVTIAQYLYPARKTGPHTPDCKQEAYLSTLIGSL